MNDNKKSREQLLRELSELRLENNSLRSRIVDITQNFPDIDKLDPVQGTLPEIRRRYQELMEQTRDVIFVLSNQGIITSLNKAFERITGWDVNEWIGKPFIGLLNPEDVPLAMERISRVLNGGINQELELRIRKKTEGYIFSEILSSPQVDNGIIIGILGIGRDITDRKLTEKVLHESEERFKTLSKIGNEGLMIHNNGIILDVNSAFARLIGRSSPDELIGKNGLEVIPFTPESKQVVIDHMLKSSTDSYDIELLDRNQRRVPCETESTEIFYKGTKARLVFLRDITERKKMEVELASERTLLRTLVDLLPAYIYVKDKESRFMVVNDACAHYMGASSSVELIGKTDEDFYQPDIAAGFRSDELKVLEGNSLINKEEQSVSTRGTQNILLTTKVALKDTEGNTIGLVGTSIDITEAKHAENVLKESEEWFRNLFEQSSDGIFYLTLDGKIAAVNKSFADMHGFSQDEIKNMNINDLDFTQTEQLFTERIESFKKGEKLKFEVEHIHKDGHKIPMEVTAGMITMGDKIYILASHRDITENKLAEESLRISEENFRVLFNENPLPTILSELPTGKIAFANRRMSALMNMETKDIIGKTANELAVLNNLDDQEKLTKLITMQGFVDNVEVDKLYPDGQHGTDLIFMRLVTINGKLYCLTVVQDISERKVAEKTIVKAREKAEESDRLKSAFLANMGHEIRTPMNGILGFSELLKNPALTEKEQQEYVDIIGKSGTRMLNIINDLIDVSKIESGQMNVNVSRCNLNEELEYIFSFFKPEIESKGLRFTFNCDLSTNESDIQTDREKVNAILVNLIKNAIKFTDQGSIEYGYKKKDKYLEFFIKDTGVGISPDQEKIIFERFRQGSESLNRNYEGAGLGLSISKSFVEMLDGKIWIESKPGEGSTFYFTIPYNTDAVEKSNTDSDEKIEIRNNYKKLKILIAEDDEASGIFLTNVLKTISYEIFLVKTGIEAIELCKMNPEIDLILMDIKMPGMDGYEATRQIRKFNKKVVIIAQTAYAQKGDRDKALEAGCNDYISKPIKKDELMSLINKHFAIQKNAATEN